jgi:hypothetical protein
MSEPFTGNSADPNMAGVAGVNSTPGAGVWGESAAGRGVVGVSTEGVGVWGHTQKSRAVVGANNEEGTGVWGETKTGRGVVGVVNGGAGAGVWGETTNGRGGVGVDRAEGAAVWGEATSGKGVVGVVNQGEGTAIHGVKKGPGGFAGVFEGNVKVTANLAVIGDVVLANADCAEDFDIADGPPIEPGTVMVLSADGALQASDGSYDHRVVGVVSGAGAYKPGLVLDRQESTVVRQPIALMGKVYCKADARDYAIDVGDLLTTSDVVGHAMKAADPGRAFGAVIGKSLGRLASGTGLVPVLVALQ